MRIIIYSVKFLIIVFGVLIVTTQSCQQSGQKKEIRDSLSLRKSIPESPALSPEESIKKMHLEKGFVIKLVAAEPLVTAQVAMSFDERGRIWVVEMESYMPDTLGTGEDKPTGEIVILSDTNGDGIMDERKVFLDSLVMPCALCLIENGILVAESPNLWYYEIENDRPVKKTLVDSAYAAGGNVEHQPNGLFRDLDNCKVYKAPEINGEMPGVGSNKEISDDDVAQVLNFIRNSWNNKAPKISENDVPNIRKKFKDRQKSFTIEELSKLR